MKFEISEEEAKKAKIPHEIFLTNLIGNHILWFVAALGVAGSMWLPLALVPIISLVILAYTLWRARRSRAIDPWFVMCHWQICVGRSKVFLLVLTLFATVASLGWLGYTYFGMKDVAVKAMVGGMGVLPVMVTVLVLIVMESDALHQAGQHQVPKGVVDRFPNPEIKQIETQ